MSVELGSLFEASRLAKAELVCDLQEKIFEITAESFDDVRKKVMETTIPQLNIILNILVAVECRPAKYDLLMRLCRVIPDHMELIVSVINDLMSPEQLLFVKTILSASEEEMYQSIASEISFKALVPENLGECEKLIMLDDDRELSKYIAKFSISVDSKARESIKHSCDFIRQSPTLVQLAAFFGSAKCFRLLTERGASLKFTDEDKKPLSYFAVAGGNREIIEHCKRSGLDFSGASRIAVLFHRDALLKDRIIEDSDSPSLIHDCMASNNVALAMWCLQNGEDVNAVDDRGESPIHVAVQAFAYDVLEMLLHCNKLNVNAVIAETGETALHLAAMNGMTNSVQILLTHPHINQRLSNKSGKLALHVAAENGFDPIIALMVNHGGVTINSRTDYGDSALHLAASSSQIETMRFLLESDGIDAGCKTLADETPLHCAVRAEDENAVAILLEHGIEDINAHDRDGWTPLHDAVKVFELLLGYPGIDVNSKCKSGWTPLHKAASNDEVEFASALIASPGINVNEKDSLGWTPLHAAVKSNAMAIVQELIAAPGIDVNIQDRTGTTPLHLAVKYHHHEIIEMLIECPETDINLTNATGWTALHIACLDHDQAAKDVLMTRPDLDQSKKDTLGRTAEDLAKIPSLLRMLEGLDV